MAYGLGGGQMSGNPADAGYGYGSGLGVGAYGTGARGGGASASWQEMPWYSPFGIDEDQLDPSAHTTNPQLDAWGNPINTVYDFGPFGTRYGSSYGPLGVAKAIKDHVVRGRKSFDIDAQIAAAAKAAMEINSMDAGAGPGGDTLGEVVSPQSPGLGGYSYGPSSTTSGVALPGTLEAGIPPGNFTVGPNTTFDPTHIGYDNVPYNQPVGPFSIQAYDDNLFDNMPMTIDVNQDLQEALGPGFSFESFNTNVDPYGQFTGEQDLPYFDPSITPTKQKELLAQVLPFTPPDEPAKNWEYEDIPTEEIPMPDPLDLSQAMASTAFNPWEANESVISNIAHNAALSASPREYAESAYNELVQQLAPVEPRNPQPRGRQAANDPRNPQPRPAPWLPPVVRSPAPSPVAAPLPAGVKGFNEWSGRAAELGWSPGQRGQASYQGYLSNLGIKPKPKPKPKPKSKRKSKPVVEMSSR